MRFRADEDEGLPSLGTTIDGLLPIAPGQPVTALFEVIHREQRDLGLALRAISADGFAHLREVVRWNSPTGHDGFAELTELLRDGD